MNIRPRISERKATRRARRRVLATLATLLAGCAAPTADGAGILGLWCSEAGDKLLIEPTGLADFKGTVCRFPRPIPDTATLDTEVQCDRLALTGLDELETTDTRPARLTARRPSENTLEVTISPGPARIYTACEA